MKNEHVMVKTLCLQLLKIMKLITFEPMTENILQFYSEYAEVTLVLLQKAFPQWE